MSTPQIPRGRIIVSFFTDQSRPVAEISGDIRPGDLQQMLMAVRKSYAQHLNVIGEMNKKKVEAINKDKERQLNETK